MQSCTVANNEDTLKYGSVFNGFCNGNAYCLYFVVMFPILMRYMIYLLTAIELPPSGSSTVQYSTVQYSTVQNSAVQYSTLRYSTVQYSTVH